MMNSSNELSSQRVEEGSEIVRRVWNVRSAFDLEMGRETGDLYEQCADWVNHACSRPALRTWYWIFLRLDHCEEGCSYFYDRRMLLDRAASRCGVEQHVLEKYIMLKRRFHQVTTDFPGASFPHFFRAVAKRYQQRRRRPRKFQEEQMVW